MSTHNTNPRAFSEPTIAGSEASSRRILSSSSQHSFPSDPVAKQITRLLDAHPEVEVGFRGTDLSSVDDATRQEYLMQLLSILRIDPLKSNSFVECTLGEETLAQPDVVVSEDQEPDVAHTTRNPSGGLIFVPNLTSRNLINPPSSKPLRPSPRYVLSERTLGRLERLAKARFEIRELTKEDFEDWVNSDEPIWTIAQSVNASSEIEGRHIRADQLSIAIAEQTKVEPFENEEIANRATAIKNIYRTYIWVLSRKMDPLISYDFILDLHHRMFQETRHDTAGKLKQERVTIKGAGYEVATLPPEKTEEFLRVLCERFNRKFDLAQRYSETSMFLATAEFVLDFLAIHPFTDGNGRTARLLSTYLLERSGYHFARFYPLDQVIVESRQGYYRALFEAQSRWYTQEEDLTSWIEYYANAVFTQWTRAYQRARDEHCQRTNA